MRTIRCVFVVLGLLLGSVTSAVAQVSISIGFPNVSIGINLPVFPELVPVPDYPVYYAPGLQANFFFYDGMYWVYQDDNWYASSWYNGPWGFVRPEAVPLFVLRIPVRYYRRPPMYFRGWQPDAPPRWGDHWGHDWEQHRSGWDRWDRRSSQEPAPLPVYQRQYSGDRYPRQVEQQHLLLEQNYRYQPRDPVVQEHFKEQAVQRAPLQQQRPQEGRPQEGRPQEGRPQEGRPQPERAQPERAQPERAQPERAQPERAQPGRPQPGAPEERGSRQQDIQRSTPSQQVVPDAPRASSPQQGREDAKRTAPASPQQGRPEVQDRRQPQREQQTPGSQGQGKKLQDKGAKPDQKGKRGKEQEQERGRGRND